MGAERRDTVRPRTAVIIAEGLVAGVVAHLGIALILAIADLLTGRSLLFTPNLLGSVLLEGSGGCDVAPQLTTLLAYTSIHLSTLAGFGILGSYLIQASEQRPILWFGALLLFIGVAWHLTAAVLTLLGPVGDCVGLWWIVTASFTGALAMAAYLWRAHAPLRARLHDDQYA
jgi:hypothetical protein